MKTTKNHRYVNMCHDWARKIYMCICLCIQHVAIFLNVCMVFAWCPFWRIFFKKSTRKGTINIFRSSNRETERSEVKRNRVLQVLKLLFWFPFVCVFQFVHHLLSLITSTGKGLFYLMSNLNSSLYRLFDRACREWAKRWKQKQFDRFEMSCNSGNAIVYNNFNKKLSIHCFYRKVLCGFSSFHCSKGHLRVHFMYSGANWLNASDRPSARSVRLTIQTSSQPFLDV